MITKREFFSAILSNNIEIVKTAILKENFDINTYHECSKQTALHMAIFNCNIPLLEFLLDHKADINAQDKYQLTPMISAKTCMQLNNNQDKKEAYLQIIRILLQHVTETSNPEDIIRSFKVLHILSDNDYSLLHRLTYFTNWRIVVAAIKVLDEYTGLQLFPDNLIQRFAELRTSENPEIQYAAKIYFITHPTLSQRQFFRAVIYGDLDELERIILEEKVDINMISHISHQTALEIAVSKHNISLVQFLIAHGANVLSLKTAIFYLNHDNEDYRQIFFLLLENYTSNDWNDLIEYIKTLNKRRLSDNHYKILYKLLCYNDWTITVHIIQLLFYRKNIPEYVIKRIINLKNNENITTEVTTFMEIHNIKTESYFWNYFRRSSQDAIPLLPKEHDE